MRTYQERQEGGQTYGGRMHGGEMKIAGLKEDQLYWRFQMIRQVWDEEVEHA